MRYKLVVSIMILGCSLAHAVSCDKLDGIQRLACEKSVHKRGLKRSTSGDAVIDTSANILQTMSHQQKQGSVSKKPKVRIPHNRKTAAHHVGIDPQKKNSRRLKGAKKPDLAKANHHVEGVKRADPAKHAELESRVTHPKSFHVADAGLSSMHNQVLQSDIDVAPDFVMPSRMEMLASDADTMFIDGVGDAELYRVY